MSNYCKSDTIFVKMENFEGFDDKKFSPKGCLVIMGYNVKCINCLCKKQKKQGRFRSIALSVDGTKYL